jgi:hypothetical protein
MNQKKPERQRSEYENFRQLAKNLLAVPKSEADQKREAYENKKKRGNEKKK